MLQDYSENSCEQFLGEAPTFHYAEEYTSHQHYAQHNRGYQRCTKGNSEYHYCSVQDVGYQPYVHQNLGYFHNPSYPEEETGYPHYPEEEKRHSHCAKQETDHQQCTDKDYVKEPNQIDYEAYRTENKITVQGSEVPHPMCLFTDTPFPDYCMKNIEEQGYKSPTPIQAQGWPILLKGHDLVGIARTGSGKTLTYMLPAVVHITNQPPLDLDEGPIVVVLAPTRELVQQIHTVTKDFLKGSNIRTVCLYGGAPKQHQAEEIGKGAEICIATPGRLLDFIDDYITNLCRCTYIVLDEADRMLDMGFEGQIKKIFNEARNDRQTLMFSATWPKEVCRLAEQYLKDYMHLNIGAMHLSANHNIRQIVDILEEDQKPQRLLRILQKVHHKDGKVLIFAKTKWKVRIVAESIIAKGWRASYTHGDIPQEKREQILQDFRKGHCSILVATDVASRGLDVENINYVVNYDYPNCSEDYVHRIGRTARNDNFGTAFTFFTESDIDEANELVSILKESKQKINPRLMELASQAKKSGVKKKPRRWRSSGQDSGQGSLY